MVFVEHLPVGISFFGAAWSEPILIELAFCFEQATNARKAPKFISTHTSTTLNRKSGIFIQRNRTVKKCE